MNKIMVGILGFAHGHVNMYCEEWSEHPEYGVDVVAGWDHEIERLNIACNKYEFQACSDIDELLQVKDIQAVVISAETSMYAELVERAASYGKSIILQKPMAWQMRVDPQNIKMKDLIASGSLGKVFKVRRHHGLSMGLNSDFADSWHVNPKYNRDIWADDASHPFDFILWLLGMPQSITAEVESLYNPRIPMDNGVAIFRYVNGPLAEVDCSFTCAASENTTEIILERGTIIQNFGDAVSCNVP